MKKLAFVRRRQTNWGVDLSLFRLPFYTPLAGNFEPEWSGGQMEPPQYFTQNKNQAPFVRAVRSREITTALICSTVFKLQN